MGKQGQVARLLVVFLLIGGVALGAGLGAPSRAASVAPDVRATLSGWLPDNPLEHHEQASAKYFGRSVVALRDSAPQIDVDLRFTEAPESGSTVMVSGKGTLRVGSDLYAVTINQGERLEVTSRQNGDRLFVGGLMATFRTKGGITEGFLGVVHSPESQHTMVTATIGQLGSEVLMGFGNQFLTAEELQSLRAPK